jgi:hypothetical protein
MQCVPCFYEQDKLLGRHSVELIGEQLTESCCSRGTGTVQKPRRKERPPLEALAIRLVKAQLAEKT